MTQGRRSGYLRNVGSLLRRAVQILIGPYERLTLNANVHGFNVFTTAVEPGLAVFHYQVSWLDSVLIGPTEG